VNSRVFWPGWARQARVIGFSIAGSLLLAAGAWAQVTFTVNSTDDGVDANVVDGKCEIPPPAPPGTCTLRAAVMQANRMPGAGAIIQLPAGTYKLSIPASIADGEENGDLNLNVPAGYSPGPTTIVGKGQGITVIDGLGQDRIFEIERTVGIYDVSLVNGFVTGGDGGCILNLSSLTFVDSTIFNCEATQSGGHFGFGGAISGQGATSIMNLIGVTIVGNRAHVAAGIHDEGYLQLTRSSVIGNAASGSGGGLLTTYHVATIDRSTISGNSADSGGGIWASLTTYVINSTISANSARTHGGGIFNSGITNIYNTTIAFNEADADAGGGFGGGIYNQFGSTFNIRNSVLAGNYLSGAPTFFSDCTGTLGIYGNDRLGNTTGCTLVVNSPSAVYLVNSLNELGALKDNGGPTKTIALIPPSNIIDAGIAGLECLDQNGQPLTTDQRGRPRIIGTYCDIGAFEYDPGDIFASGFQ
jgi:CSLREA domain-containing protein